MTPEEFSNQIAEALENDDLESLERLQGEFVDQGETSRAFEPNIGLRNAEVELEGDVAIGLANGLSRAIRNIKYRRMRRSGYSGPVVVSEGDSWFQYPVFLNDVIDNLSERYAIYSLGAAGDTLSNMLAEAEYLSAIVEENADYLLISASGNDVLGGGDISQLLLDYQGGMEVEDLIRADAVEQALQRIESGYARIINEAQNAHAGIKILFHGYDRPVPRRGGKWLGGPMASRNIPPFMQREVAGLLIDRLNHRLSGLEDRFPRIVRHVDCRGHVGDNQRSWYDELHPRNPGYGRVAALFEGQIEAMRDEHAIVTIPFSRVTATDEVSTPADEYWAESDEETINDTEGSVIGRQSRQSREFSRLDLEMIADCQELQRNQEQPDQDKRLRARRHMVPVDDASAFERILGISNLFPINFLSRGATKARAVAKIQLFVRGGIPAGSGSGFLVAPGLMLTNNHVVSSREAARLARITFDYQEDDQFQNLMTKTFDAADEVFFTSDRKELDFTFMSVKQVNSAGQHLSEFGQLDLIEESGKAIKSEPVSIIQHPSGGLKSIALRDSKILGVKGDFIYYSTDTQPGSSGSPVLNDQWLPVALHHRSVRHPQISGKWIANRGIRISRIFVALRQAAQKGDSDANRILRLLGAENAPHTIPTPTDRRPLRARELDFMPSVANAATADTRLPSTEEANFQAERWGGINGYDADFLSRRIALPLPDGNTNVNEIDGRPDLPYLHFSVVMHRTRKLPMMTACNVDGSSIRRLSRRGDWRFDPRLPYSEQVGNDAYRYNEFDRGHMVRRLAPMWGTEEEARFAEADTFHYTVSAPQHARLNQRAWLELEDYLLDWANNHDARLSIFTGPVFRPDDPLYRGIVQIPSDFWKVAVAESSSGFRAVGYLHTQKNLIPTVDEAFGDYRTHRVPIKIIQELSGLNLSSLIDEDIANEGFEAAGLIKVVEGPEDIGF